MKLLGNFLLLVLICIPTFMQIGNDRVSLVAAEDDGVEDAVEGEDDEGVIETDEGVVEDSTTETAATEKDKDEDEEQEEDKALKSSPDADTHILFTKPLSRDFVAGSLVRFLVGFSNNGEKEFIVDTMDASFRYPQDFSFFIQNFTAIRYSRTVEPKKQATFEYGFTPSENYHSRPFGLTINLNYHDIDGNLFQEAVFNDTINIVEADDGLDGETFFLYLFLGAGAILAVVGVQQFFSTYGKRRLLPKSKTPVEQGTQNHKDQVDYDWLPPTINDYNKQSPNARKSPKQSPGRRKNKNA